MDYFTFTYLVTPHQMQNCVNYCRNKASKWDRAKENKTQMYSVCAQMQNAMCHSAFALRFSHRLLKRWAVTSIGFSVPLHSALSDSHCLTYSWRLKDKSQISGKEEGEVYGPFSISWKLSQITLSTKLILQNVQATPTKCFFLLSFFAVSGAFNDWSELQFREHNIAKDISKAFVACVSINLSNSNAQR